VAANDGEALARQAREIGGLQRAWARAQPEPAAAVTLVDGRPLPTGTLAQLRSILREMLERPSPAGGVDLRANVARIARTLDDLSRRRVLGLPPEAFAEYLELTGRYAARSDTPPAARRPSRIARLLARGFLFTVLAAQAQIADGRRGGLRLGLRVRLLRLLLHTHGIGPAVGDLDVRGARRAAVDLADPQVQALVFHYLRATIETLGTGRRPVLEEMSVAVAFLNSALTLAAMRAAREGRERASVETVTAALVDASDLTHSERGLLAGVLATLAGGVESLYLFASGGSGVAAAT
jgi:hypothetical protein